MADPQVIRDLIASAPPKSSYYDGYYRGIYPLTLPPGRYGSRESPIAEPIVVDRPVKIDAWGVELVTAPGVDAVRVVGDGAFSTIGGVTCYPVNEFAVNAAYGIDVQCFGVRLTDVNVRGYGTGIRFWGTFGNGTNANLGCIDGNSFIYGCHDVALHLKGGDCNAGTFLAVGIVGGVVKSRIGLLDESFLGNVFAGMHISGTRQEAIYASPVANYSTHVGCYVENDCGFELPAGAPKIACGSRVTWIGGNAISHAPAGDRVGLGQSNVGFTGKATNGDLLSMRIPHAALDAYWSCTHMAASGSGRPSGGTELAMRRHPTAKTLQMVTRNLGVLKEVFAATRADHTEGQGKMFAAPKTAAGDPPAIRYMKRQPLNAEGVVGEVWLVNLPNVGITAYEKMASTNGDYWSQVAIGGS